MRSINYALIACLAAAAVLAGCAGSPNQSTDNNTNEVSGDVNVTCPTDTTTGTNSTMDTNSTSCGTTDNSTTETNTTG